MRSRILVAVGVGGALGSAARYGLGTWWPDGPGFPWTTFAINVGGCFAIGVLVGLLGPRPHPVVRPLLGTGFLGGFTTFSTYAVQADRLALGGRPATAAGYVLATLLAALAAAWLGLRVTRR